MPFLEMVLTIDKVDTFLDGRRICRKYGEMTFYIQQMNTFRVLSDRNNTVFLG